MGIVVFLEFGLFGDLFTWHPQLFFSLGCDVPVEFEMSSVRCVDQLVHFLFFLFIIVQLIMHLFQFNWLELAFFEDLKMRKCIFLELFHPVINVVDLVLIQMDRKVNRFHSTITKMNSNHMESSINLNHQGGTALPIWCIDSVLNYCLYSLLRRNVLDFTNTS